MVKKKSRIKKFYEPDVRRFKKLIKEGKLDPDVLKYLKEKGAIRNPKDEPIYLPADLEWYGWADQPKAKKSETR